ncbi:hypothetical protein SRHO_G00315490 [Serrasalmus rhombeus]
MADLLLTVYDDDQSNVFFDCTICNRRLNGETQYKVHLTTLQHLKKEEAEAAKGLIPMPLPLPEWTDIKQYLKYLNLDEPIIGLGALVQEEDAVTDDGKVQLRYRCKMCAVVMDMCTMVCHIVSRKHRQKYLQLKRPDLVTWQKNSSQKQPGLVAKAKAALVEKQEGWGCPVALSRPNEGQRQKKDYQGHGREEDTHSYTHERSYSGRDRSGPFPLAEDGYKRSYLKDDALGKPSRYHEVDLYEISSKDNAAHGRSYPENNRCEMTNYQGGRQRYYEDDNCSEGAYLKGDISVRSFLEEDSSGRHQIDRTIPARAYSGKRQDECYPEINLRRGWNSNSDMQDVHRGGLPGSKFADTEMSGSSRYLEDTDYRQDRQIQDRMYTSCEGRGRSIDELQRPRRSFQYAEEERKHVPNVENTARAGSFEVPDYTQRHRDDLEDYTQEHRPAKRKRKSRFSDATPLEIALAQTRFIETMALKNPGRAVPTKSQDFHRWVDQRGDMQEERCLDDHGFQETTTYEHGHRVFQEARTVTNDPTSLQESRRFEDNSRNVKNERYFEDRRHIQDMKGYEKDSYQESSKYKDLPRDFQESRQCEYDRTNFQQSRGFENSRDYQHGRCFVDGPAGFQQAKEFKDKPKGFQRGEHFEDYPSGFQQARRFDENPRVGHVDEPRSFQNIRQSRGTDKPIGYENYEGRRAGADGRYSEGDFRHSQASLDSQREFQWDPKRRGSAERSEDLKNYYPRYDNDDRRDTRVFSESLWKSRPQRKEEKVYGARQAQRPRYQRDGDSGAEPYDPFHPSSSPPQELAPPSSLEKLAVTLLELMARKSN